MPPTPEEQFALFFEEPGIYRRPPACYGILYLLRRDINSCLGGSGPLLNRSPVQILWPGAMSILAGIDLLAKFLAGEDISPVGDRFRSFVKRYFQPLDVDDEKAIYQLRNSLLHSFGLYSEAYDGTIYRFTLTLRADRPPLVQHPGQDYQVDIISLHDAFEKAIGKYRQELQTDSELMQNFLKMFPKYGTTHIP